VSSDWATLKGLNYFGQWFRRTRHDSSLWPPDLRNWFEWTHGFESKLTQEQFCQWIAQGADDDTLENYMYRVKTYEKWADIDNFSETRVKNIKEMNFHTALGMTGFLSLKTKGGGHRPVFTDDAWIFREVLKGRINPATDYYPDYPVGRGVGKKLASALDMMCISLRGTSIHDVMVRIDFAQGNPKWREKDIMQGGWLANLIEGKIYNVDLINLEQIADCVESYLRRYQKSSITFGVTDLVALLSRDKVGTIMISQEREDLAEVANLVYLYCTGKNMDYDNFTNKELGINKSRWKLIEKGERPSSSEYDILSYVLQRPRGMIEAAWESTQITDRSVLHREV
jgi:hypothetical protein